MTRFLLPVLLLIFGVAASIQLGPAYDPAAAWRLQYGRAAYIEAARAQALWLGLPAERWNAVPSVSANRQRAEYWRQHAADPDQQLLPVSTITVALVPPGPAGALLVTLRPDRSIYGWEWRDPAHPAPPTPELADPLAEQAFRQVIGTAAPAFRLVTRAAESRGGLQYTWERPALSPTGLKARFQVVVLTGRVKSASLTSEWNQPPPDQLAGRLHWPSMIYGALVTIATLLSIAFYMFGTVRESTRRHLEHGFFFRFVLFLTGLSLLAMWLGGGWERTYMERLQNEDLLNAPVLLIALLFVIFTLLPTLAVAAGGAALVGPLGRSWGTFRNLFSSRIFTRPVGAGLVAGLCAGPLVYCLPEIFAATGWFSNFRLPWPDADEIVSPIPLFDALRSSGPFLDGMLSFGLMWPLLIWASGRVRLLPVVRNVLFGILLLLFFAGYHGTSLRPIGLALGSSAIIAGVLWYLFRGFDLLAVVACLFSAQLTRTAAAYLLQPAADLRFHGMLQILVLAFLFIGGLVIMAAGRQPVQEDSRSDDSPADDRSEREVLKAELSVAQRAQQEMLPNAPPQIPGLSLAASCTPARDVGGDLFDFLPLADGRWGISVADVSGKGVPAALYMTLTKGLLVATTRDSADLSCILNEVNTHLHAAGRRKIFVTMALAVLDPATRTLEYARAGHNPIVWRRHAIDDTALLAPAGMGLGITAGKIFQRSLQVQHIQPSPGDTLVFYSDGLTEAMNADQEQFGEERLMAVVAQTDRMTAREAHDHILQTVRLFLDGIHPQDDLTLVVLRVEPDE